MSYNRLATILNKNSRFLCILFINLNIFKHEKIKKMIKIAQKSIHNLTFGTICSIIVFVLLKKREKRRVFIYFKQQNYILHKRVYKST